MGIDTAGAYGSGDYFPAAPAAAGTVTAVPEPVAWLPAGLAIVAGLMFRRRVGGSGSV